MKVELISTGSELLVGKVNTNAAYIGSKLNSIGIDLSAISNIGDKKKDLIEELSRAVKRSNIIIITGGLGPTFDDITVEAVAETLAVETYTDTKVINSIKEYFLRRGIENIPKINEKQAEIIKGAKVLENRLGTAPGQMVHFEYKDGEKSLRKTIFLLPGPPGEMQQIFEENVEPFFKSYFSGIKKNEIIHIFGLSEAAVEETIEPVIEAATFGDSGSVEFAILARDAMIDVKFSVSGTNEMLVDEKLGNLKLELSNALKDNIFGYGNDDLSSIVGKLLTESRKSISFAESCTGGMLASKITDIPGSSAYFKSSVITYSNESKIKVLGVKEETIEQFGAVSEQTAKEMAEGIMNFAGSDYAVSITGIAGPEGGSKDKPIGLVYIGLADKKKTEVFKFVFNGLRKDIRRRAVNTALDLLRRKLQKDTELKKTRSQNKRK